MVHIKKKIIKKRKKKLQHVLKTGTAAVLEACAASLIRTPIPSADPSEGMLHKEEGAGETTL